MAISDKIVVAMIVCGAVLFAVSFGKTEIQKFRTQHAEIANTIDEGQKLLNQNESEITTSEEVEESTTNTPNGAPCVPNVHVNNTEKHHDSERFLMMCKDFGGRWSNFVGMSKTWLDLACVLNRTLILRHYSQYYENAAALAIKGTETNIDLGLFLDLELLGKELENCARVKTFAAAATADHEEANSDGSAASSDDQGRSDGVGQWPRVLSETVVERTVCRSYAIVEAVEQDEINMHLSAQAECFPKARVSPVVACGALDFLKRQVNQTLVAVQGRKYAKNTQTAIGGLQTEFAWHMLPHPDLWKVARKNHNLWLTNSSGNTTFLKPRSLGIHFRLGDFEKYGHVNWTRTFSRVDEVIRTENITHVAVASNANQEQRAEILDRLHKIDEHLRVTICTADNERVSRELHGGDSVAFGLLLLDQIWMSITDVFLSDSSEKSTFSKVIQSWRDYRGETGPMLLL